VLLRGNLEIYFTSDREPDLSPGLWRASRASVDDVFEAPSPIKELNDGGDAHSPTLTADGLVIYFTSTRPGSVGSAIWFATRPGLDAPFSAPERATELDSESDESAPGISADGLEIFFASERADGVGELDLWRATRTSLDQPFGPPENVFELNTPHDEVFPRLSADGSTLYFNYATETAGDLDADVWEARRECLQP
jgi:Tol biopolymer transport system component